MGTGPRQKSTRIVRPSFWVGLLCLGCGAAPPAPVLDLPSRPIDALGGAQVAREIRALDVDAREERIYAEVSSGNVPTWFRRLEPVEITDEVGGRQHRVTFWVTPDYLAVGSDDDFFLVPLSGRTGQRIADLLGCSLPTRRMVDAVWASARVRLTPIRIEPDDSMRTVRYFERHNHLISGQRLLYKVPPGTFVAGHKVDVVLSPALAEKPGNVALYGWHTLDGRPVHTLYTGREDGLVVFSHGIRLVDRRIHIDGVGRDLPHVLSDPGLAALLSDEGVIAEARYPVLRNHP
ncbi:hypothetical protein ACGF5M_05080 [Gemmatimonadota bacterium]